MDEKDKQLSYLAADNIKQIENIYNENNGYKRNILYNKCLIGRNVDYLKSKLNMTDKKLDQLLINCKGLSMQNRNAYVRLHKLADLYPNIMYVNVAFRDIVKYFKYLSEFLEKDKDFWSAM